MKSIYIHGTEPEEQERLSLLNRIINDACLRELNLQKGECVLDVGSGLGQFTREMASTSGCRVVGLERSPEQLQTALRLASEAGQADLVEFRQGDALEMPLEPDEWGSFDVVHTRFLLEHVPDPGAVVRQMARACAPGGRVVLVDDDHDLLKLWPEDPAWDRLWRAYTDSYRAIGNDPIVGRRLVSLLVEAGLRPRRNTGIFFGSCQGHPSFQGLVDNLLGVVETAFGAMISHGLLTDNEIAAGMGYAAAWRTLPDATLWYSAAWAEGIKT